MQQKQMYSRDELLQCGRGELFGPDNLRVPLPNMLMLDRIVHMADATGTFGKGEAVAVLDIHPDLWFFEGHFQDDPVMPGCLGLDALWQLLGFFLAWKGYPGKGRAFGVGAVQFKEPILPTATLVTYRLDIKHIVARTLVLGLADGTVSVDGRVVYLASDLKVGLLPPPSP